MKRRDFLEKLGLSSRKINLGFLEGEFAPRPTRAFGNGASGGLDGTRRDLRVD